MYCKLWKYFDGGGELSSWSNKFFKQLFLRGGESGVDGVGLGLDDVDLDVGVLKGVFVGS